MDKELRQLHRFLLDNQLAVILQHPHKIDRDWCRSSRRGECSTGQEAIDCGLCAKNTRRGYLDELGSFVPLILANIAVQLLLEQRVSSPNTCAQGDGIGSIRLAALSHNIIHQIDLVYSDSIAPTISGDAYKVVCI